ncbi:MAG: ScpA family protein [Clostridiales bacterium]
MSYQVVLPVFEGPMDLLLHLIDTHKLDIYNIPISFITGQYMDYLKKAEEIDLNLSGDFLVMAGTLLAIKAKLLLPKRPQETAEGMEELDPRDELVEKLLEYRLYKENAQELKKMESSQTRIYYREVDDKRLLTLFPPPNPIGNLKAGDLHKAFQEVLRLMTARGQTITLQKDTMSLKDHMDLMLTTLAGHGGSAKFADLLTPCQTVMEVVTAFLAMLELLAKGRIWVRQDSLFGEIFVCINNIPEKEEPAFESISAGD